MSDLGEFGSPLPSYPTLPGSMERPYSNDPVSDPASNSAPPTTVPDPSRELRLATPDELGYPLSSAVGPMSLGYNTSPQQQRYQSMQPQSRRNTEPDSGAHSLLHSEQVLSLPTDNTSNYYSLSPGLDGSTPTTTSNVPIYATVRKPHTSTPSLHSATPTQASARLRTVSGSPATADSGSLDFSSQSPPIQYPPTSSMTDPGILTIRVKHWESLCGKLTREKSDMAEAFGRQRKSFMNQMAHSDAQLTLCKQRVEKYSVEVQELSKQVLTKDEELQNVTIAAGITEATIRERFDVERVKYEEEIASLSKIVSGECTSTVMDVVSSVLISGLSHAKEKESVT